MKSFAVVVCASVVALATLSQADDRTPEQIKAAKDFMIEGIGFSATPQTIRAKWQFAKTVEKESNPKIGFEVLRVGETPNTDGIDFCFLDGKLMQMWVWYAPQRLNKIGGWDVILDRLIKKFGKGDADSKGTKVDTEDGEVYQIDWVIPEAERWVRYDVKKKVAVLQIWDREVARKKEAKEKATAETGF